MKKVLFAIIALAFASITFTASAQTGAEKTDLVIQMIWQNKEGNVIDNRYLRMVVGPGCNPSADNRVLWSSREGTDMIGRVLCLPSGAPIPSIEVGIFTIVVPPPS